MYAKLVENISATFLIWCDLGPMLPLVSSEKLHTRFRLVTKSMTLDDLAFY